MLGHIDPVVAAGVEMEFVGNAARAERFVQGYGAGVETEVIFRAAIKIDMQSGETRGSRDGQRIILFPESGIERRAENIAENPRPGRLARIGNGNRGKLFQQSRTMGAHGAEELRMAEGQVQSAIAAHGNPGNAAVGASGLRAIAFFDLGKKFLEKKILVTKAAVTGVYVEAGASIRRDDQKIAELTPLPEVLDKIESARMDEHLLVVAESMKKIEDRVAASFFRVIAGRQDDAVSDGMAEDFAGRGKAFGADGGAKGLWRGEAAEQKNRRCNATATKSHLIFSQEYKKHFLSRVSVSAKFDVEVLSDASRNRGSPILIGWSQDGTPRAFLRKHKNRNHERNFLDDFYS